MKKIEKSWMFMVMLLVVTVPVNAYARDGEEHYRVIAFGGIDVGHLDVIKKGDTVSIDYDYKNNGRGPTMKEELTLAGNGFPLRWELKGNSTNPFKVTAIGIIRIHSKYLDTSLKTLV